MLVKAIGKGAIYTPGIEQSTSTMFTCKSELFISRKKNKIHYLTFINLRKIQFSCKTWPLCEKIKII